jgi:hypothetical protein
MRWSRAASGDSVRSVGDFYGGSQYEVGGLEYSLDDIEHGLLRANEPPRRGRAPADARGRSAPARGADPVRRAACTSRCIPPAARRRGWRRSHETGLDVQLESATRRYLSAHLRWIPDCKALRVPKMFDWLRGGLRRSRGVCARLSSRASSATRTSRRSTARAGGIAVKYLEYDWALNYR